MEKIPFSEELEQQVLGSLLLAPHCWDEIAGSLSIDDFYVSRHKVIFSTLKQLLDKNLPVDVILLTEELRKIGELSEIGEIYLFELIRNTATWANVQHYVAILRAASLDRKMLKVTSEIITSISEKKDNRLEIAQKKIAELSSEDISEILYAKQILPSVIEKIDDRRNNPGSLVGVSTGFIDLDRMTYGLQKGDLIILGARPSMGKTLLSINIAEHVAFSLEKTVVIFSLEMKSEKLIERIISSRAKIELEKIKTGRLSQQEFAKISQILPDFNKANLVIDDRSSLTVEQIRAKCWAVKKKHGIDLVIVDYITLMSGQGENETHRIGAISTGLRRIAQDMDVPVIAITQLNRSVESGQDKRPTMSHIRQSGTIEQDADVIMFIYRDEVYNPQTEQKGVAEILIAKQRDGAIGKVNLAFHGNLARFDNYTGRAYETKPVLQTYKGRSFSYDDDN